MAFLFLNCELNYTLTNYGTMFADEIRIHYGWSNIWQGSEGCQTIRPGSAKGYKNHKDKIKHYKDYIDFMDIMVPKEQRKDGTFIGYYYLERL